MPTLAEDLRQLMVVQGVDSRINRLRNEKVVLNDGSALAAAYNTGKIAFDRLRAEAVHAQGEQRDAELRLESIEVKTASVNTKMYGNTALSARELSDLQKELEMLGRQKGDAEDKALAAMEASGEALTQASSSETKLLSYAEEYKKVRAAFKKRSAEIDAEVAMLEKERTGVAKPVTPALLARYDSLRARRSGVGAALLDSNNNCGGCHMQNSTGTAGDAAARVSVTTCEHCGRILVPAD